MSESLFHPDAITGGNIMLRAKDTTETTYHCADCGFDAVYYKDTDINFCNSCDSWLCSDHFREHHCVEEEASMRIVREYERAIGIIEGTARLIE